MADDELSEQEHQILEFEEQSFRYAGAKDRAITEQLGLTPTRYYQLLTRLLDDQRALAQYPMLVKRLRAKRRTQDRVIPPAADHEDSPAQKGQIG